MSTSYLKRKRTFWSNCAFEDAGDTVLADIAEAMEQNFKLDLTRRAIS